MALSWSMDQRVDEFLSELDGRALEQAAGMLDRSVEQNRRFVLSQVAVLADDTRVRAPVMTPNFDEATVKDVLDDLKRSAGASMLAVLDTAGKVRAVTGVPGLREVDLSSSPVVKAALERPSTDVWTLPDRAMVVGVAAVRSGGQVAALLVLGFEIGEPLLSAIHRALGVAGAVVIVDRVTATSSSDPALVAAFRAASAIDGEGQQLIQSGWNFVARVSRTSNSATAGKVVWLVREHHQTGRVTWLRVMVWVPVLLVGATFALVLLLARQRNARNLAPG
jgi:Double sensory domain of two-component sensor kinase